MDPLNQEFLRLLDVSGWNQAEAARQLSLKPGTVSQYVSGVTRPSSTTLKLFKLLIGDRTPVPAMGEIAQDVPRPNDEEEQELLDKLRELEPDARRAALSGFRIMFQGMRKREVSYLKKPNK